MINSRFFPLAALGLLGSLSAHAETCVVQSAETFNCREVEATLISGEQRQQDKAVACLQNNGLWKVVSGPGYGMSFSGRSTTVPYLGGSYMVNGVYFKQPDHIQFNVMHNSACVPELPADLRTPIIVSPYPLQPGVAPSYPTLPAVTNSSRNVP